MCCKKSKKPVLIACQLVLTYKPLGIEGSCGWVNMVPSKCTSTQTSECGLIQKEGLCRYN